MHKIERNVYFKLKLSKARLKLKYLLAKKDTKIDLNQENLAELAYNNESCTWCKDPSFFVGNMDQKIITNAVIYGFILPLCVYLQYVPVPLPSYTPLQLAYVNLPLT